MLPDAEGSKYIECCIDDRSSISSSSPSSTLVFSWLDDIAELEEEVSCVVKHVFEVDEDTKDARKCVGGRSIRMVVLRRVKA